MFVVEIVVFFVQIRQSSPSVIWVLLNIFLNLETAAKMQNSV
jgi:hypothetical protein